MWWALTQLTPRWSHARELKYFCSGAGLGDDLSRLAERREGAGHKSGQSEHDATEPDEHWRGSFPGRRSDDLNIASSTRSRRDRRYTGVQVDEAKLVRGAFPDW